MLPVNKAQFGTLQKFGMGWSRNLKYAGAACNGLVMQGKTFVVGDALEKQLFRAVEAQYVVSSDCCFTAMTATGVPAHCQIMKAPISACINSVFVNM